MGSRSHLHKTPGFTSPVSIPEESAMYKAGESTEVIPTLRVHLHLRQTESIPEHTQIHLVCDG